MSSQPAMPVDARSMLDQLLQTVVGSHARAELMLNLTPSENRCSVAARIPMLTDSYNRYFFNPTLDEAAWNFAGAKDLGWVERDVVIHQLQELVPLAHVNVRPLSGLHAMTVAVSGLTDPGHLVASIDPGICGHYATEALVGRLGLRSLTLKAGDPGQPPTPADVEDLLSTSDVDLLYLDFANLLALPDLREIVRVAKSVSPGTIVHADMSHLLGFLFAGSFGDVFADGLDSLSASTHKTFPGPQRGLVMTRDSHAATAVGRAQFNMISSHHFASVLSLGLSLLEFAIIDRRAYIEDTVALARAVAAAFAGNAWTVAGKAEHGYTRTHHVWLAPGGPMGSGRTLAAEMYQKGVVLNVIDDLPGMPPDAVRLGFAEAVRGGLRAADADDLVEAFLRPEREAGVVMRSLRERMADRISEYSPLASTDAALGDALSRTVGAR